MYSVITLYQYMFTTVNQVQGTRITDCLYVLALKIRDMIPCLFLASALD